MKVGDLVKLVAYKHVTGLIVGVWPNVHMHPIFFNVLIDGNIHPVMKDMLEVISASR